MNNGSNRGMKRPASPQSVVMDTSKNIVNYSDQNQLNDDLSVEKFPWSDLDKVRLISRVSLKTNDSTYAMLSYIANNSGASVAGFCAKVVADAAEKEAIRLFNLLNK